MKSPVLKLREVSEEPNCLENLKPQQWLSVLSAQRWLNGAVQFVLPTSEEVREHVVERGNRSLRVPFHQTVKRLTGSSDSPLFIQ